MLWFGTTKGVAGRGSFCGIGAEGVCDSEVHLLITSTILIKAIEASWINRHSAIFALSFPSSPFYLSSTFFLSRGFVFSCAHFSNALALFLFLCS